MEEKIKVNNPLIGQDYPDVDIIRVCDTYYMISTTMYFMPGGVILRSYDLANWEIAGYVYDTLDNTPAQMLENDSNIYGQGMWAASLRYHKGMFYVCFVANDTHKTYLYTSENVEGPWKKKTIEGFYHDCSLLFDDDDRVYIMYGNRTIYITELDENLDGPKKGGLHRIAVKDDDEAMLGYEGCHLYKINGRYYAFFIHSSKEEWFRSEACFTADSIDGEFRGGDVLRDDMGYRHSGVAQGGIVDTPEGDYYAILFQDRGAVGRIPVLIPVDMSGEFPVFGGNGKIPDNIEVTSTKPGYRYEPLYASDDFCYVPGADGKVKLKNVWQWNHNPHNELWSVTERKGALRLHSGKICSRLTQSYNTLTQRTIETVSEAVVTVSAEGINDGDFAGIAALQGLYGAVAVTKTDGRYELVMFEKNPDTADSSSDDEIERERIQLNSPVVKLKCVTDYTDGKDEAKFYYEKDNKLIMAGSPKKLFFRLDHFTGCRFALFYYSTKQMGGYSDFMNFEINCIHK